MVAGTALAYLHRLVQHYRVQELSGKYLKSGIPALIYLACKTREELVPIRDIFSVVYVLRVGDDEPERLHNVSIPFCLCCLVADDSDYRTGLFPSQA